MKNVWLTILTACLLLALPCASQGDGKFYARAQENVPPHIPYQRALLLFDGEHETLIVQSKYESQIVASGDQALGWILPVPSVPELGSMPATAAEDLFTGLALGSYPEVWSIWESMGVLMLLMNLALTAVGVVMVPWLFVKLISAVRHRAEESVRDGLAFLSFGLSGFILFSWACTLFLAVPSVISMGAGPANVEVVKCETAGIYDITVVRSQNAGDLIEWLDGNHFQFAAEDTTVFNSYLKRGWCFVVAKANRSYEYGAKDVLSEGLVAPLVLHFRTDSAVYPLALTSTIGQETEVLLYVLSSGTMQCDGKLKRRYAGSTSWRVESELDFIVWSSGYLSEWDKEDDSVPCFTLFPSDEDMEFPYLTKFKDRLAPAEMREDLTLSLAAGNLPYRERKIVWW